MFGTMDMITQAHRYQQERIALADRYRLLSAARHARQGWRARRGRRDDPGTEAAGAVSGPAGGTPPEGTGVAATAADTRAVTLAPCGQRETAPAR